MQQPPSDRSNKNPYATPSAWPRAPQQTFYLRVPKAPPGAQAAQPAPKPAAPTPAPAPRPARQSSILTGSALPVGQANPRSAPEADLFIVKPATAAAPTPAATAPVARPTVVAAPPRSPVVDPIIRAPEAEPEVNPAPIFIAPPEAPFPARRPSVRRSQSRAPLFIGAAAAVVVAMAGAGWLLLREPDAERTTVLEPSAPTPAEQQPVVTPPEFLGLAAEPEASPEPEPVLRGPAEPAQAARATPARQPASRLASVARPAANATMAAPSSAISVTPAAPTIAAQPLVVPPLPTPPPPASAPGPQTPVADPDTPQTTRDPSTGD